MAVHRLPSGQLRDGRRARAPLTLTLTLTPALTLTLAPNPNPNPDPNQASPSACRARPARPPTRRRRRSAPSAYPAGTPALATPSAASAACSTTASSLTACPTASSARAVSSTARRRASNPSPNLNPDPDPNPNPNPNQAPRRASGRQHRSRRTAQTRHASGSARSQASVSAGTSRHAPRATVACCAIRARRATGVSRRRNASSARWGSTTSASATASYLEPIQLVPNPNP